MTAAQGFQSSRSVKVRRRRLAIHVARVGTWSFGEQTAAVRRRVDDGHASSGRQIEQWIGVAIQQGVPVVTDHRFEAAKIDVFQHQVDRPAGEAKMANDALLGEATKGLQSAMRLGDLVEADVLRVVQIADIEVVEGEESKTTLDAPEHLLATELTGIEVPVRFRRHDESGRNATKLLNNQSDASLALAITIGGRGVEKVDGAGEERSQGRQGINFGDGVREGLRHVTEGRAANT